MRLKSLRDAFWVATMSWLVPVGALAQGPEPLSVVASCEPDFEREWNHHDLALGFITALNARAPGAIGMYVRPGATLQDLSTGEVMAFEQAPLEIDDIYLEVMGTLNGGNQVALSLRSDRDPGDSTLLLIHFAGGCIYGVAQAS